MEAIDLNSDLGEHFGVWRLGDDEAMLGVVTSANVACGFHAGDPKSILDTVRAAHERGVAVGAHVAYPDLVGFGRRRMDIPFDELRADVMYQLGALQALAHAVGTEVRYVKPHGSLYNRIAHDEQQAAAVIDAIRAVNPELPLVCLAGAPLVDQARAAGIRPVAEAFADRAYNADGTLCSREQEGAVLHDPEQVADRMLHLTRTGTIRSRDGHDIALEAESICVHGDSPGAVELARTVRRRLEEAGVVLAAFADAG